MIGISVHFSSQPSIPTMPTQADRGAPVPAPIEPGSTAVPENSKKVSPTVTTQNSETVTRKKGDLEVEKYSSTTLIKADKDAQLISAQDLKHIEKLKQRDIEVRAHEAAHLAAAGQYATSGAKFQFTRGPDGRSYAIGGSVGIDTGAEATPEATIRKADQIKRAALAPAEPSEQDRSVAAQAAALKLEAQAEIAREPREESLNEAGTDPNNPNPNTAAITGGSSNTKPSTPEAEQAAASSINTSSDFSSASNFNAVSANISKLATYQAIAQQATGQIDGFA